MRHRRRPALPRFETHDEELETHTERLERQETETDRVEAVAEATRKRTGTNKARIEELQARELEKGAHLRADNVDEHEVDVPDDRLERIAKTDGGTYYRLPEHEDPLDRTDDVALAHGDLLPIQQFARMDADMRRSAKKLVSRTIDAALELSKHRLAVCKHIQRKNGYDLAVLKLENYIDLKGTRTATLACRLNRTATISGTYRQSLGS